MELYVNGGQVDVTLENEKTIGDVLRSFEVTCEQNNAAVIGITVNGEKIDASSFDAESVKPLEKNTKIEFDVVTKEAVSQSFVKLTSLFNELADRMEQVPVELQSGKDKQAHESIRQLADNIETFCHTAALASLFPETYTAVVIDGKPFSKFFEEFSPILNDFEQALKSNDTVTVGDLSEYEICPRLRSIAKALEGFK